MGRTGESDQDGRDGRMDQEHPAIVHFPRSKDGREETARHAPRISSHPGDPGPCPDLGPSSYPFNPGSNAWGGRIRSAPTVDGDPGPKIPPPFPADPIRPTFGNLATQTILSPSHSPRINVPTSGTLRPIQLPPPKLSRTCPE